MLSVIIPVFNDEENIKRCLDAVFGSNYRDFEVIVVDDHSSDDSLKMAKQYRCKLINLKKNIGAAGARNVGVQSARGDHLFFLDSDIVIERDTLSAIMRTFEEKPEISALFCSFQEKTLPSNFFSIYKNLVHHYTHQNSKTEAATFCGGFGAIKKEVFTSIGGFDPEYRSLEDVEFGYRLHKAGHKIFLNKAIQVTHCKQYSFVGLIKSDLINRAIPWTKIMLQKKIFKNDLNTKTSNVFSVILSFLILLSLPFLALFPQLVWGVTLLIAIFLILNSHFFSFVKRVQGLRFATLAVPMNWFFYLYSGFGLIIGIFSFIAGDKQSTASAKHTQVEPSTAKEN